LWFPTFKSFDRVKSLCYPQMGFRLVGNRLKVTPFGEIKLKLHRSIKGTVKTLVLKRESSGKWFAILTSEEKDADCHVNQGAKVGIDLGLSKLATLSDGSVLLIRVTLRSVSRRLRFWVEGFQRKRRVARIGVRRR